MLQLTPQNGESYWMIAVSRADVIKSLLLWMGAIKNNVKYL